MFFAALATDYDGTIATDGSTPPQVVEALKKFRSSGRKLILVTGRELEDLKAAFPNYGIFDRIVAENGAVLYEPATQREQALGAPPPESFVASLKQAHISPLSIGRVIVATWEPNEAAVLGIIKKLGLELQIIFNKGAVMVLPPGINKASGLAAALDDLGLSAVNVAGIGDAENDHAFLKLCGCCAAVANALPELKAQSDLVMDAPRGDGVISFMEKILTEDGDILPHDRHGIILGDGNDGERIVLPTLSGNVLIAGHSAVGKSTIATALSEEMTQKGLQFCVLDPEGDFEHLDNAVQVGGAMMPASLTEVANLIQNSGNNVVVNAMAVPLDERPKFFADVLAIVSESRIRSARPHWLIVDEAHHVLPQGSQTASQGLPRDLQGTIFITVHPDSMTKVALEMVHFVVAAGETANDVLTSFCDAVGTPPPSGSVSCGENKVLLWDRKATHGIVCLSPRTPAQVHRRHTRKYAQGELGPDKSFYFRGPTDALNLRADNLKSFLNIADGVDDATWMFHREHGDYSRWFRDVIKDNELAHGAAVIEQDRSLDAKASRAQLRTEIDRRYTAPAREPNR